MLLPRRLIPALAASALAAPALAQGRYPNRSIRFLIPWPPGGSLDALHRQMFELFQRETGQSVVVENMPGARGTRAAFFLTQQARPDGYTLAHHHLSILRHPFLTRQPTWDPVADFSYVMQMTGFVFGTAVRADSPWRTWADLLAEARRRPGQLTYSTSGIATTNHLAMEDILAREGLRMEHIPTRGAQEGVTMLLGRQIDMVCDAQSWRPQVEAGEFRLLAAWTPTRARQRPRCADPARAWLRHERHLALWHRRAQGDGPGDRGLPASYPAKGHAGRDEPSHHAPLGNARRVSWPGGIPRLRRRACDL
jgi:tripartite-type tricarboxylate transporter receptor subunit TctC